MLWLADRRYIRLDFLRAVCVSTRYTDTGGLPHGGEPERACKTTRRRPRRMAAKHEASCATHAGYISAWCGARMRQDMSPYMFGSGVVFVVCTVLAVSWDGLTVAIFVIGSPDVSGMELEDGLSRDAMFTAGATILGLVAFGTLLNVLFMRGTKPPYRRRTIRMLGAGAALITALACSLMLTSCCFPWSWGLPTLFTVLIAGGALLVMGGAFRIIDAWFDHWEAEDATDKA